MERLFCTQEVAGSIPVRSTMRSSQWESGPLWGVQCHSGVPVFRDDRAGFDSRRRARHCSRAETCAVKRCGLASTGFSWARFRQGYSLVGESPDVHGQLSRVRVPLPRYGSLAQWMERPVTSREVVGSSPTRPTHGAWYGSALLSFVACCGVCYGVGACCRLVREPVGVLLCFHSSQSSSGTGWV